MNRRKFIGTTMLGTAALGLPSVLRAQPGEVNILMIVIDDLNDWVGCLGGHPQAHTPNIDALASMGTNFTHAYCAAPACSPSRANLLTGMLPSTSGVYDNPDIWTEINPDAVGMHTHFGDNGYFTMSGGKIDHRDSGIYWDQRAAAEPARRPPDMMINRMEVTQGNKWDWGPIDLRAEETGDWIIGDWVNQRLLAPPDSPFLLGYGIHRPHTPQHCPRSFYEMFPLSEVQLPPFLEGDLDDIPQSGVDNAARYLHTRVTKNKQWRKAVASYLANSAFVDMLIGRVLDTWDASPLRDDTMIMLTSDHGWHLGQKNHWTKFALWEEATQIPLIFHAPWLPSGVCEQPVTLTDVFPTFVDVCGIPAPGNQLEGESLLPQLMNPLTPRNTPALTTWLPGNHAVRDIRWRYIRYADNTEELYDHDTDPNEWTNLASDPQYDAIKAELGSWMPDDG